MSKKKMIISTNKAPEAIGPYSQGVIFGDLIFTSGQLPLTHEGHIIADDIESQAKQVLENLKAVIEAAGSSLDKVLKTTIFLSDMNNFAAVNDIYELYFPSDFPARSTVQVAKLPKNVLIEIEAIAHL